MNRTRRKKIKLQVRGTYRHRGYWIWQRFVAHLGAKYNCHIYV